MASGYTVGQHRVGNKQCAVKPSAVFPCSNKWVFIRSHVYQQFSMPFSIWLDTADVSSSPASLGAALQQPLCLNHFAFPMCSSCLSLCSWWIWEACCAFTLLHDALCPQEGLGEWRSKGLQSGSPLGAELPWAWLFGSHWRSRPFQDHSSTTVKLFLYCPLRELFFWFCSLFDFAVLSV